MSDKPIQSFDKRTVLIAGANRAYLDLLAYILETEGFAALRMDGKIKSPKRAPGLKADVIVLDCGSLEAPAIDVLRRIREDPHTASTPVVLLTDGPATAMATVSADGAQDHHVWKSAGPHGIVAGIRRALRDEAALSETETLNYADVKMDVATHRVLRGNREVYLTPTEFRLLQHFLAHPERVFTREQLAQAAWPIESGVGERTVDVHMGRLRRALGAGCEQDLIRTVRSIGYSLSGK